MSATSAHGRRRADSARNPSRQEAKRPGSASAAASHSNARRVSPAKRMAVVAIAGALLAGGGLTQAGAHNGTGDFSAASLTSITASNAAPSAISAPSDAAIAFSSVPLGSSTASSTSPTVKSEADAVTAVGSPAAAPAAAVVADDPAAAKAYAATTLSARGWGAEQMSCLTQLWERESSWLTSAENPSSGAYGIAQSLPASKMESVGADWATNYQTQIAWGLTYIAGRYGTPCGAWGHSNAVGWY